MSLKQSIGVPYLYKFTAGLILLLFNGEISFAQNTPDSTAKDSILLKQIEEQMRQLRASFNALTEELKALRAKTQTTVNPDDRH